MAQVDGNVCEDSGFHYFSKSCFVCESLMENQNHFVKNSFVANEEPADCLAVFVLKEISQWEAQDICTGVLWFSEFSASRKCFTVDNPLNHI